MTDKEFFRGVTHSRDDIVQLLLSLLAETQAGYCVIGGLAVNAYAEPVVSLDLDLVVVADRLDALRVAALDKGLKVQQFEHSLNLSAAKSDLRKPVGREVRPAHPVPNRHGLDNYRQRGFEVFKTKRT